MSSQSIISKYIASIPRSISSGSDSDDDLSFEENDNDIYITSDIILDSDEYLDLVNKFYGRYHLREDMNIFEKECEDIYDLLKKMTD